MAWMSFLGRLVGKGRRRELGELSDDELRRKIVRAERRRGRRPRSRYQLRLMREYDGRFANNFGDCGGDYDHKATDVLSEARRRRGRPAGRRRRARA